MDPYIKDLCEAIQNGEMENTYKMVWIRSIVETCVLEPSLQTIHFDKLSKKIFGYYWNQTIYFDLEQSPNPQKRPEIYQIVVEEIERYRSKYGYQPQWFSRIENKVDVPNKKISSILTKDVCWRFPKVGGTTYNLYDLDKKNRTISLFNPNLLVDYSKVLFDLINYRWTQKLEEFNHSPRISKKVRGTDREDIKRSPLTKYKKYLDLENPEHICFHTGKKIEDENLSIDHVLPWSYLFSDDLWNLVYVDRSFNSSKGNQIPSEETINKLEKRNLILMEKVNSIGMLDKNIEELQLSITDGLVKKFWVGCQG
mgnify:FL=1